MTLPQAFADTLIASLAFGVLAAALLWLVDRRRGIR